MTELTVGQTTDQPIEPGQKLRFDDRIDTDTEISSAQVLSIIGRSFKLLSNVKMLFTAKFVAVFRHDYTAPADAVDRQNSCR